MAKLINVVGTAIIIIVIVLCLSLIVPRFFGISCYTVVTGSMEPNVPVGSVVYAKATDPQLLETGEIIVFYDGRNNAPIVHRIVENQSNLNQVITKGDANDSIDITPVYYNNIVGKVVLHIPVLGRLLSLLGTGMGKVAMFLLIIAGFLLCEAARRLRD